MNSEKVKEIKECLEEFKDDRIGYYTNGIDCFVLTKEDILALINELETENERLMKLQSRGGCRVAELGIENQQLKDKVTELESENKELKHLNNSISLGADLHAESYQQEITELEEENQQLKGRIAELEDEIERLEAVIDIANERLYRKKFIEEWRKEYQKELDKEGEGHIAGFPDFDLVYKLYFEQKDRIAELETENAIIKNSVAMRDYKTLEEMSNNKVKQFAERLKEKLGSVDLIRGWAVKVFIDETLKEYE